MSSVIQTAVSVSLRRNISVRAVPFNKELDSVQKLFIGRVENMELGDRHLEDPLMLVQSVRKNWTESFLNVSKCMVKQT